MGFVQITEFVPAMQDFNQVLTENTAHRCVQEGAELGETVSELKLADANQGKNIFYFCSIFLFVILVLFSFSSCFTIFKFTS